LPLDHRLRMGDALFIAVSSASDEVIPFSQQRDTVLGSDGFGS